MSSDRMSSCEAERRFKPGMIPIETKRPGRLAVHSCAQSNDDMQLVRGQMTRRQARISKSSKIPTIKGTTD